MKKLWMSIRWPLIIAAVLTAILAGFEIKAHMAGTDHTSRAESVQIDAVFFAVAFGLTIFARIWLWGFRLGEKAADKLLNNK